jgi:hypothetical protein
MGVELPLVSAVLARFPDPEIHLAAYGGIVFPLALLIEAPIIMLLAASTALSKDWASYVRLRRFMMWAGGGLTAVHVLIAFTPLYDVVVRGVIGVPEAIVEPGRTGMMLMTPWTWAIAHRRFQQGVLIRFGHARAIGIGTAVRLAANGSVLAIGSAWGALPGIAVGAAAVATGVLCEALFVALWVRPVLRDRLRPAPPSGETITLKSFLAFYVPLAMTSMIGMLTLPLISLALSRMPGALESLAIWPVMSGLVFMLRALGFAFNEVVVALVDQPHSVGGLRRFAILLATCNSSVLLLIAATPLAGFWFGRMSGLSPALTALAGRAIWIALAQPAFSVWQSWFQGIIVSGRRTRGVPEAILIAIVTMASTLAGGIAAGWVTGIYVGLTATVLGNAAQLIWLRHRSRAPLAVLERRDRDLVAPPAGDSPG